MNKEYIPREAAILAVRHAWAKGLEPTQYIEQIPALDDRLLLVLPCRIGNNIYHIIDKCTLPGDCGTKRMCNGCEYRDLSIEETTFRLYLLDDDGKLRRGYYCTYEEAEKAKHSIEKLQVKHTKND